MYAQGTARKATVPCSELGKVGEVLVLILYFLRAPCFLLLSVVALSPGNWLEQSHANELTATNDPR